MTIKTSVFVPGWFFNRTIEVELATHAELVANPERFKLLDFYKRNSLRRCFVCKQDTQINTRLISTNLDNGRIVESVCSCSACSTLFTPNSVVQVA